MSHAGGFIFPPDPAEFREVSVKQGKPISLALSILALLCVLALFAALMAAYIKAEKQREQQQWQSRLALVAQAKADTVSDWVTTRRNELQELAGNASLQFYLSRLKLEKGSATALSEPDAVPAGAEADYLKNLIRTSAIRLGYAAADHERLPANVSQNLASGLALFDSTGRMVSVSADANETLGRQQALVSEVVESGKPASSALQSDSPRSTVFAMAVPVNATLGATANAGEGVIGVLVGLRSASSELFSLLEQDGFFAISSEALLLENSEDNSVNALYKSAQGVRLDSKADAAGTALVLADGRSEMVEASSLAGGSVLAVARPVIGQPWFVVQQVDAGAALYDSRRRQRSLWWTMALALLSLAGLAVAAWRHGRSVQAQRLAGEMEAKAGELQQQTDLLHGITDSIDVHALLLDQQQRVFFANQPLLKAVEEREEKIDRKSLAALLGTEASSVLLEDIEARHSGRVMAIKHGLIDADFQVKVVPLERVGEHRNPVLLTLTDVSELQAAQAAQSATLRGVINTLVGAVDAHDPYSADHSARVETVAKILGEQLQLSAADLEALQLAARLSNVGKIKLPAELLSRNNDLSEAEHEQLQQHVQYALDLLAGLGLDEQVLDIVAQKQELIDGSGYPRGLSDSQMSPAGKILAVANAFIALLSPRAYRASLPAEEAVDYLMQLSGVKYDRSVLAALLHVQENRNLDEELASAD